MPNIRLVINNPSISKEMIEEEIQKYCEEFNITKDEIKIISKEEFEKEKTTMTEAIPVFD